jgi:type IV secretory pathway protease TraF
MTCADNPIKKSTAKVLIIGGTLGTALAFGVQQFHSHHMSVAIDTQNIVQCLPYSLSILDPIDRSTDEVSIGQLVSINHKGLGGSFKETSSNKLMKLIVGKEGDSVSRRGNRIYVNDELVGNYPPKTPDGFKDALENGDVIKLTSDQFWAMGSYQTAADSRYVGPIPLDNMVETAMPVL